MKAALCFLVISIAVTLILAESQYDDDEYDEDEYNNDKEYELATKEDNELATQEDTPLSLFQLTASLEELQNELTVEKRVRKGRKNCRHGKHRTQTLGDDRGSPNKKKETKLNKIGRMYKMSHLKYAGLHVYLWN